MIESVDYKHQLRIARDTLRMNPAMVGVMGGMTIEEARAFLDKHNEAQRKVRNAINRARHEAYTSLGLKRTRNGNYE
jgi:hypothetical protein